MTGPVNPVAASVQWALHGKGPDGEGYRILSCSTGDLSRANFQDVLERFSLGALDGLPQVSVSYLQPATRRTDGSYLALAIEWTGTDGQRSASGIAPRDEHGRRTAFTSYFCTPYRPLARHGTTYQDMFEAFSGVTLPATDGPAKTLAIKSSSKRMTDIDELALHVAPLLLTGSPICVLNADATSLAERLRFIDAVMALLPYAFRARMTAATWTRSTHQNHRFRLYFSNAPRTDQQDHVVSWEAPSQVYLPRGQVREYFEWLADKVSPIAGLADLHELSDLRFDNTAVTKVLELAYSLRGRRRAWSHEQYPPHQPSGSDGDVPQSPAGQAGASRQARPGAPDKVTAALQECAEHIEEHSIVRLRSAVSLLVKQAGADSQLKQRAEADPALEAEAKAVEGRRRRYRELVREYGLLRPHGLGSRDKDLYAALLEVAFGRPLSYTSYCRVEECLDGALEEHPHPALLNAIKDGEMAFETKAIVLYLTRQERSEKELNKWYASGEVEPASLVEWLSRHWSRVHHARVACDFTLDYLARAPVQYDQGSLRLALRQHGFLAHALHLRHPDKEQYQISALHRLIRAAYPGPLDRQAIEQIMTGATHPPTPALLAAVLMNVSAAEDVQFAQEAYVHGSLTRIRVHPETYTQLVTRVPALDPGPGTARLTGPLTARVTRDDPTETILQQCAGQALAKNLAGLRDSLTALRVYSAYAANRGRYRQIITEHQLLSADLGLGGLTDEFYDALLRLAFGTPLVYQGYCQLSDCLPAAGQPGRRPPEALLLAIDRATVAGLPGGRPDLRVTAIVAAHLDSWQRAGKSRPRQPDLSRFTDGKFRSGHLDAVRLIEALAEVWERPRHAELLLEVLCGHLIAARSRGAGYDRPAVLRALQAHGHLAPALRDRYPESEPVQIAALAQLLDAVYPDRLDEPTAWTILSPEAQTDALLTVITGKSDDPKVKARITRLIRDSGPHRQHRDG